MMSRLGFLIFLAVAMVAAGREKPVVETPLPTAVGPYGVAAVEPRRSGGRCPVTYTVLLASILDVLDMNPCQ
jgi:hypothetical protein